MRFFLCVLIPFLKFLLEDFFDIFFLYIGITLEVMGPTVFAYARRSSSFVFRLRRKKGLKGWGPTPYGLI